MRLTQAQLARLKNLESTQGQLTARSVVEDAKKKSSPLHKLFNWDQRNAAEHWWLHRARLIIGSVTVQVTHSHAVVKACGYVVDTAANATEGGGYRSLMSLRNDPTAARESLVYTLEVAAGHLRRAYDLAAPLGLDTEIDALLAQIVGVVKLVEQKVA